jgi:hypothetical protein
MKSRSYGSPEAFKHALEARVRRAAMEGGVDMGRFRQLLVFDRFLARVSGELGDRVVVKGGLVLELRLQRARTTRDVDLRITGDPHELLGHLQRAADRDLGDDLSFIISQDAEHPTIEGDGMIYDGRRFRAEARLAGMLYGSPFGVDAGFGDVLTEEPEIIEGTSFLSFIDVAPARIRVYPRETHVAEKLHAYTLPRARENTRVKDLPDLALLGQTGPFDCARLRGALERTFGFRGTHPLPGRLPSPPQAWAPVYARMAGDDGLPWATLSQLEQAARDFLDPVLTGGGGAWDVSSWAWHGGAR